MSTEATSTSAEPRSDRMALIAARLGMDLIDYIEEARYGDGETDVPWSVVAEFLTDDTGVPVSGTTVARYLSRWMQAHGKEKIRRGSWMWRWLHRPNQGWTGGFSKYVPYEWEFPELAKESE